MPALRFLTADLALTLDGDTVLEVAASTRAADQAAVQAEVAALLAWCHAQQPQGHAPRDEGGLWHHDLHSTSEPGGWHTVHLTITGDTGFIEALHQVFFPPDAD